MTQLTKEHFEKHLDKKLDGFVTKEHFDQQIKSLATKQDLKDQEIRLKDHINQKTTVLRNEIGGLMTDLHGETVDKIDQQTKELKYYSDQNTIKLTEEIGDLVTDFHGETMERFDQLEKQPVKQKKQLKVV